MFLTVCFVQRTCSVSGMESICTGMVLYDARVSYQISYTLHSLTIVELSINMVVGTS